MPLLFNGWDSLDWITVGFLSFALVFTFMFSKGTSVHYFLFISDSEANVPELFLIVSRTNMKKYGSPSSSLHFCRFFSIVWIALSTKPLLWRNTELGILCMKCHDLENVLNSCELYWGPLSVNTTLGMSCHANILLMWILTVSDKTFGSLGQSIWGWTSLILLQSWV